MNRFPVRAATAALAAMLALPAFAQQSPAAKVGVTVKATGGQSAQQQARDESECLRKATRETGVDPRKSARVANVTDAGARAGGAASADGAAESVQGAAAGELAGADNAATDLGGAKATGQPSPEQVQQDAAFKRAFGACLEGRSYVVRY